MSATPGRGSGLLWAIPTYWAARASCLFRVHASPTRSKIERIKGPAPRPRADHAVCVAGNLLILTGGRGSATKGFSGYYEDVHVLDLTDQEWKRPASSKPGGRGRQGRAMKLAPAAGHPAPLVGAIKSA